MEAAPGLLAASKQVPTPVIDTSHDLRYPKYSTCVQTKTTFQSVTASCDTHMSVLWTTKVTPGIVVHVWYA